MTGLGQFLLYVWRLYFSLSHLELTYLWKSYFLQYWGSNSPKNSLIFEVTVLSVGKYNISTLFLFLSPVVEGTYLRNFNKLAHLFIFLCPYMYVLYLLDYCLRTLINHLSLFLEFNEFVVSHEMSSCKLGIMTATNIRKSGCYIALLIMLLRLLLQLLGMAYVSWALFNFVFYVFCSGDMRLQAKLQ